MQKHGGHGDALSTTRARVIRGMEFVHCTEVVCFSESPLLEVSLYTANSNNITIYQC